MFYYLILIILPLIFGKSTGNQNHPFICTCTCCNLPACTPTTQGEVNIDNCVGCEKLCGDSFDSCKLTGNGGEVSASCLNKTNKRKGTEKHDDKMVEKDTTDATTPAILLDVNV